MKNFLLPYLSFISILVISGLISIENQDVDPYQPASELIADSDVSENDHETDSRNHDSESQSPDQNKIVDSRREELGYGGFVIVDQYANGYVVRTRYMPCPNCRGTRHCVSCHGTGNCGICHGQGHIISAGYGNYYPCHACQGTGKCHSCGGTKDCACTLSPNKYPGYVIGSISTIAPDGTVSRDNTDYGSRSHDHATDSRQKKVCPDCDGTGLWRKGQEPEYAMPASGLIGYYNKPAQVCPHCGYIDEHWHSKCTTCKHYSGTENPYK